MSKNKMNIGEFFYQKNYNILKDWNLIPSKKIRLGDRDNLNCRFCKKSYPDVKFEKVAHAIPECLGNKSISTYYECDTCNELFGNGIENQLGIWSKNRRTIMRVIGKKGIPKLKKKQEDYSYEIQATQNNLNIKFYKDTPFCLIDEVRKTVTFQLKQDNYSPIKVFKAFVKIGLTLIPDSEMKNYSSLYNWIIATDDYADAPPNCAIMRTFIPGNMRPFNKVIILKRKPKIENYPYMQIIVSSGNDVYQIPLFSTYEDKTLYYMKEDMPVFPTPKLSASNEFGPNKIERINLSSSKNFNDMETVVFGFNGIKKS